MFFTSKAFSGKLRTEGLRLSTGLAVGEREDREPRRGWEECGEDEWGEETPLHLWKFGEYDIEGDEGEKVGEGVGVVCERVGVVMCFGDVTMSVMFLAMIRRSSVACFVEKV